MIGQTVAQYQIKDKLGEGGMGVVYRAWDTRLHRFVALKFLPERVASDPDALQRLRREARAASGLNHPNICTIYDFAEEDGRWFIAMEMLEGKTLHDRLAAGRPAMAEIVDWALQLADALDVAHSRGIIHRDLKPTNVLITERGFLKVLDFGLAKRNWQLQKAAVSVTMSADGELTSPGSTVGTVGYMSPEQTRGLELDNRTDLFSTGALLYELITEKRAFTGQTTALIFNAILNGTPAKPTALNPECPPELEHIVLKCLEKDREVRYQSAAELRADLRRLQRGSETTKVVVAEPKSRRGTYAMLAAGALLLVAAAVVVTIKFWPQKSGPVSQADWVPLTRYSDSAVQPTISRDGRLLAFLRSSETFIGQGQVYVKVLPDGEPVALTHDDTAKLAPSFSPDGSQVSYGICCTPWATWVVPVFGGTPRQLFANATGLTWIDADHILFSEIKQGIHMGLVTATAQRTQTRDIYLPEHERGMIHFSSLSPDHKWVLMVEMGGDGTFVPCRVVPFDGNAKPRPVGPNAPCTAVAWSPNGKWMYFTADAGEHSHIWRQKFPDGTLEQVTAGPNDENGIAFSPDGRYFVTSVGSVDSSVWVHDSTGDHQISSEEKAFAAQFAPDGSKVYYLVRRTDEHGATLNELWSSDLQGHGQPVLPGIAIEDPGFSVSYALSPDGKHVVYVHTTVEGTGARRTRLWIARTDNGASPLEFKADADEDSPIVTRDGTIYFRAAENGKNYLYRMRMDGSGRQKVLSNSIIDINDVSRDGAWVSFGEAGGPDSEAGGMLYSLRENRPPIKLCSFCVPRFSWDGKDVYTPSVGEQNSQLYRVSFAKILAETSRFPDGFDFDHFPGAKPVGDKYGSLAPSPDPAVYAFSRPTVRRNLYKIPVR